LEPPVLDLTRGSISPCLVQWRGTCLGWILQVNGHPGSTQILTRHCGAKSQTVSPLANSGTTPTSRSPQFSTSGLSKHLRTGSVRTPYHILTTRTELWDTASHSDKAVRMELSLCLRFYLRHNLRADTVGTTMGFLADTVEAITLQSRHRIMWMCPW
jgi:hypothetical protein